ncbi:unnamed protein product [Toxocara canis]|uniref:Wsv079 n=1 Tax=Toxocara canis TaxID=6265 RepID=A0A183V4S4_TOXCA|nr:unnamed protein product [Toxocara canis]
MASQKSIPSDSPSSNCCSDVFDDFNSGSSTSRFTRRKAFAHSRNRNERISWASCDSEFPNVRRSSFISRLLPHGIIRRDSSLKLKFKRCDSTKREDHSVSTAPSLLNEGSVGNEVSSSSNNEICNRKASDETNVTIDTLRYSAESRKEYEHSLNAVMDFIRGTYNDRYHTPVISNVKALKDEPIAPGGITMIVASMDDAVELHSALLNRTDERMNETMMMRSVSHENDESRRENNSERVYKTWNGGEVLSKLICDEKGSSLPHNVVVTPDCLSLSSSYLDCSCERCSQLLTDGNQNSSSKEQLESEDVLKGTKCTQKYDDVHKTIALFNFDQSNSESMCSLTSDNKWLYSSIEMYAHSANIQIDALLADNVEYPKGYVHKNGPSRHTIYSFVDPIQLPDDYSLHRPTLIRLTSGEKLARACAKNMIEVCV